MDLALRGEGVACVALHPGYVKTEINRGDGDIGVEESARSMLTGMHASFPFHLTWNCCWGIGGGEEHPRDAGRCACAPALLWLECTPPQWGMCWPAAIRSRTGAQALHGRVVLSG